MRKCWATTKLTGIDATQRVMLSSERDPSSLQEEQQNYNILLFVWHICVKEYVARDLTMEVWRSDWLNSASSQHYITVKPPSSLVQVWMLLFIYSPYFDLSCTFCWKSCFMSICCVLYSKRCIRKLLVLCSVLLMMCWGDRKCLQHVKIPLWQSPQVPSGSSPSPPVNR